jgi:simple sugar transport system ATP-binding protein
MTNELDLVQIDGVSKYFGHVVALENVSLTIRPGEIACILGDNGAGKSTLIKILSGVLVPDRGRYLIDGEPAQLASPRDAIARGIATVYQDLAMIPLMSVARNFVLGHEPVRGVRPFRRFDLRAAAKTARAELARMGIELRDTTQPVGTLSGGERQCVAIARAIHYGARMLILDEPTAALGVKQSGVVLRYVAQAKQHGVGVIFITHNPHHAYLVGDRFTILNRGRVETAVTRANVTREELTQHMSGGRELDELDHELERIVTA